MRTCGQYEDMISAFIDGRLAEADRRALMEHMGSCPACQSYFDQQIAIHDALLDAAGQEEIQAPEGFAEEVAARIRFTPQEKPLRKKPPARWRSWTALAACCAAAAVGLWNAGSLNRPEKLEMAVTSQAAGDAGGGPAALPETARALPEDDSPCTAEDTVQDRLDAPNDRDSAAAPSEKSVLHTAPSAADSTETVNGAEAADDAETADSSALPAEPAASGQEDGSHALQSGAEPAPMAILPQDSGIEGKAKRETEGALYQSVLATSGTAAAAWVEEQLGLPWTAGERYELSEEEYMRLRLLLEESGEAFSESQEPGEGFLLIAENSWDTE